MGLPLTLTFTYTRELHDRAVRELSRGRFILRPWQVHALIGLIIGWAAFGVLSVTKTPLSTRVAIAAAVVVAAILYFRTRITANPTTPLPLDQTVAIRVTEEGLHSRLGDSENHRPWLDFLRLNEDSEYLYIHWKNLHFQTIPKAAFASPEDVEALRALLRGMVAAAPSEPRPLRAILGRTRPVFYLLFLGAIALIMFAGRSLTDPVADIGVQEFLELKAKGLIQEVRVRERELIVVLKQEIPKNGATYWRLRLPRPANDEDLDFLMEDLPAR